jgi:hypothetical protein
MQTQLNVAGYDCGTPDGIFSDNTDSIVRNFQHDANLAVNGKADKDTLVALEAAVLKSGDYSVIFDDTTKQFNSNQQVVYEYLRNAGFGKIAIAGIMGNIHAETVFNTAWGGHDGSVGICQWTGDRKTFLEAYANSVSGSKTDIAVQVAFIIEEGSSSSSYYNKYASDCFDSLKDTTKVDSVKKAADYFMALYERCQNESPWSEVESACASTSWLTLDRFSRDPNSYNQKYYIDTPKRRGYAESYYSSLLKI